jgi:putative transposase
VATAASLCRGILFHIELPIIVVANCVMRDNRGSRYPARPPRLQSRFSNLRPFYFVTFNTYRRFHLLARRDIHEAFYSFCVRAQEHGVAVGKYVLMPDHAHLFVALHTDVSLRKWVKALRLVMGKKLLALGFQKPHWHEGFFDHLLRSRESYSQKWDYVRMNPVRAGLSRTPEEWLYQGEIVSLGFD